MSIKQIFEATVKTNHWLLLFSSLFLIFTGWLGLYVYTHANIIPNLEFAYAVNEMQHGRASQVFISRVIRGMMWEWHWYIGLFFTAQMLIVALTAKPLQSIRSNPFTFLFVVTTIILLVTGCFRYYRGEIPFMGEEDRFWRNLMRDTHRYSAYFFIFLIFGHVAHVVYLNSKKHKRIISGMFRLRGFVLRKTRTSKERYAELENLKAMGVGAITVFALLGTYAYATTSSFPTIIIVKKLTKSNHEKDPRYQEAMEFYSGKKGYWHEIREYPMCPYDACLETNDAVQAVSKDGMLQYKMKMHNFLEAKKFFDKAVKESGNPLAASKNLIMFMERLNYKDKLYDELLLEHTIESLGVKNVAQIKKEVQENIQFIDETVECSVLYKAGEIYEMGFFDVPLNTQRAKELYTFATKTCEKNNMFHILATNKLSTLGEP